MTVDMSTLKVGDSVRVKPTRTYGCDGIYAEDGLLVVENIEFSPGRAWAYKLQFLGWAEETFTPTGEWDTEPGEFDILEIIPAVHTPVEVLVTVTTEAPQHIEVLREEFPEVIKQLTLAQKTIMKYGVGHAQGIELTAIEIRRNAIFKHTDHVAGLTTWTLRDDSQVLLQNGTYRIGL